MVVDILSRVACHRGCNEPLRMNLERITEIGAADTTQRRLQELLAPVLDASHEADLRPVIMRHLCDCLSETTGKRWQRIYGGLVLTENLVQQGSHVLLIETAHGHHFDLVQKISFLEHFDSAARGCSDQRAQHCIRKKAKDLRSMLLPRLKKASVEELPQNAGLGYKDSLSTCSPGGLSNCTTTATADSSYACNLRSIIHDGHLNQPVTMSSLEETLESLKQSMEPEEQDMSRERFGLVIDASHDPDSRQVIMCHLRRCLAEPSAKHWRHIHSGLVLAELLMEDGSPLIFTEPTPGVDLDLPQQIRLLEEFEYPVDWRAQNLIRKKAIELWEKMVPWLLNSDRKEELASKACKQIDEAFSTLRSWAESCDSISSCSRTSAIEASPSEVLSDVSEAELQCEMSRYSPAASGGADSSSIPASRKTSAAGTASRAFSEVDDGDIAEDAFFTPLQTPAMCPAGWRTPHLISL
mmetsp:Transcript_9518/g.19597  ORF Transcript_9518/g.19597 Transcript_9518/m.19597 type:complete len:468 (-) Transcript_9518:469-1872(-)